MDDGNFHPTGSCFDDSVEFLKHKVLTEPGAALNYNLVHALIYDEHGVEHAHSWVEESGSGAVWTAGMRDGQRIYLRIADRQRFYDFVEAHDITRYTVFEAREADALHKCPPPWEQRYKERCADYGRLTVV